MRKEDGEAIEEAQKAVLAARASGEGLGQAEEQLVRACGASDETVAAKMYDREVWGLVVASCMGKTVDAGPKIDVAFKRLVTRTRDDKSYWVGEIGFFYEYSGSIAGMISALQSLQAAGWTSIELELSGGSDFEETVYRDATAAELEALRERRAARDREEQDRVMAAQRAQWEELNKIFGEKP